MKIGLKSIVSYLFAENKNVFPIVGILIKSKF